MSHNPFLIKHRFGWLVWFWLVCWYYFVYLCGFVVVVVFGVFFLFVWLVGWGFFVFLVFFFFIRICLHCEHLGAGLVGS